MMDAASVNDTEMIWSGQHRSYWRRDVDGRAAGYVVSPELAGRWVRQDAEALTAHCGDDKMIVFHALPGEQVVPDARFMETYADAVLPVAPAPAAPPAEVKQLREVAMQIAWDETGIDWEASEADEQATRLRVCAERRQQWPGSDDECDHDGCCEECDFDMAKTHETEASKVRRATARRIHARLAAVPEAPAQASVPLDALPKQIGRVYLSERCSNGECLCSHSHDVPAGHPLYWPERMGEYPDDIDPLCLAHAIEQAEIDQGWCEKCLADEFAADTPEAPARCEGEGLREALIAVARQIPGVICADGVSDAFLLGIPDELAHYTITHPATDAGGAS